MSGQVRLAHAAQSDGGASIRSSSPKVETTANARSPRPSFAYLLSCELRRLKTDFGTRGDGGLLIFARRVALSVAASEPDSGRLSHTGRFGMQMPAAKASKAPPVLRGAVPPRLQHAEAERLQRDYKVERDYALRLLRERAVGASSKPRRRKTTKSSAPAINYRSPVYDCLEVYDPASPADEAEETGPEIGSSVERRSKAPAPRLAAGRRRELPLQQVAEEGCRRKLSRALGQWRLIHASLRNRDEMLREYQQTLPVRLAWRRWCRRIAEAASTQKLQRKTADLRTSLSRAFARVHFRLTMRRAGDTDLQMQRAKLRAAIAIWRASLPLQAAWRSWQGGLAGAAKAADALRQRQLRSALGAWKQRADEATVKLHLTTLDGKSSSMVISRQTTQAELHACLAREHKLAPSVFRVWWHKNCALVPKVLDVDETRTLQAAGMNSGDRIVMRQAAPLCGGMNSGAETPAINTGDEVRVDGLVSKPELNGHEARVLGYDDSKGRYTVELLQDKTQLALKPANLIGLSQPEIVAKGIVEGVSHEVRAAAETEAARASEDWAKLTWHRRKELCEAAAATVLRLKINAQCESTQTLCSRLRALEPVEAATAVSETGPPFPGLGLSLAFLLLMAPLVPKGATTAEVCFYIFMPLMAGALSSVADGLVRLEACDPLTGLPYAAPATVFASHAWKYEFSLLLEALEAFVMAQPDPSRVYIWFDCAVVNQHAASSLPQEWWSTAFAAGVKAIGHTCLVLAPWRNPAPLNRCWCLWEILKTVESDSELTVQLPPSEATSFEEALVTEFDSIATSLAKIDVRQAEAFKEEDQFMILAAVDAGVGFTAVNQVVSGQLREWLALKAHAALARLPVTQRGTSKLINNLGVMLKQQGKLEQAKPLYQEQMQASKAMLGNRHANTLVSVNNMANLLQDLGELEEALPLYEEVVQGFREVLGDHHRNTLVSINNMGALLQDLGRFEEALPLFEEAMLAKRETLGDCHASTLQSINNMAGLLQAMCKLDESKPLYKEAMSARRETLGDRHPDTLQSIISMAGLLHDLGEMVEAEPLFQEALRAQRETLGDHHLDTLGSINQTGRLLQDMGKLKEANLLFDEAMQSCKVALGDSHPHTLVSINNMAGLQQDLGNLMEAKALFQEVVQARTATLGDRHPDTLQSINNMAGVLQDLGELEEAEALFKKALEAQKETLGPHHRSTLITTGNTADLLREMGRADESQAVLGDAVAVMQKILGDKHCYTMIITAVAARLQHMQPDGAKAGKALLSQTVAQMEKVLGVSHPTTTRYQKALGEMALEMEAKDTKPTPAPAP